jgi:hypothetical protein
LKHDRSCDADFVFLKVDVVPLETEQFAHPQAGSEGHEHKSALANSENSNKSLNFVRSEYHRNCLSLRTLSYQLDWIAVADVMSDSVIEDYAHEVPNFGAA